MAMRLTKRGLDVALRAISSRPWLRVQRGVDLATFAATGLLMAEPVDLHSEARR